MHNNTLTLAAPAKLNLFLHILQRRADGYHNLQTLFQFVDLADTLTFERTDQPTIDYQGPEINNNSVLHAAELFRQHTNSQLGVKIHLKKNIPMGGGLGGGSSNAATTLVALNHLWKTNLSLAELTQLGIQLGADVPIFIHGHAAWGEGIGEQLTSIELPERWFVIVHPNVNANTSEIFAHQQLTRRQSGITITNFDFQRSTNDCEVVARQLYPEIDSAMDWLNQHGSARMTGTGSCVFATFENEGKAREIAAAVPKPLTRFVAKGMNISPLHTTLQLQPIFTGASPSGKAQGFDPCIPRFESWRPSHISTSTSTQET